MTDTFSTETNAYAAIILAAGAANRYGESKILLPWGEKPIIRHVVLNVIQSGVNQVILVLGANMEKVLPVVEDLPVQIVNNLAWESGQSSSVKAGLQALNDLTNAVVILLADQPQIPVLLIKQLLEKHQEQRSPIIVPRYRGKRGNPVLFDKSVFPDLLSVTGDKGGRAIFDRFPITWVDWHDEKILLDIDTVEDYQKLLMLINP